MNSATVGFTAGRVVAWFRRLPNTSNSTSKMRSSHDPSHWAGSVG
jgi:hypothetical protein